jgi:hypothetical protein
MFIRCVSQIYVHLKKIIISPFSLLVFAPLCTLNFFFKCKLDVCARGREREHCREHIFSFLPKSSSLLIEKINREFFSRTPCINVTALRECFRSYGEVEPLNLELDSVNQFSFCSCKPPYK